MEKLEKKYNAKIQKIKDEKNKNVEEMIKKLEEKIQALKQENQSLKKNLPNQINQTQQPIENPEEKQSSIFPTKILEISGKRIQEKKLIDLTESRTRLKKVVAGLKKKWSRWFDFDTKGQNDLSIKAWGIKEIDDKVLKGVIIDMIQEWEKECEWKDLDRLEIVMNE